MVLVSALILLSKRVEDKMMEREIDWVDDNRHRKTTSRPAIVINKVP